MRRAILGFVYMGLVTLGACAQSEGAAGGSAAAGAFTNIGGSGNAGGFAGSGGSTGGTTAGGAAGQAGAAGAAGDPGSGGTVAGGTGGATGGTTSSGGSSASGGSTSTGGTTSSGGSSASGGTTSTGGTSGGGGTGGVAPKSDCCTATPFVPGCTNPTVQSCVCAKDAYCCSQDWDEVCAGETLLYKCGTCPTPTDCCSAGKCSSDAVRECVADSDATCYTTWSATCASKVTSLGCGSCGTTPPPAVVWINELHYDDASTDAGEGVEVAGTAGTDLSGWTLVFYNGAAGQLKQYMSKALAGTIPNQKNGYGTLWTAAAAIQNGGADGTPEPDGVALVDKGGKVVQLLSYEGKFTPTDGPAAGMASVDIGKSELSTTPDGQSLQLTGTGQKYSDFTWTGPLTATPGQPNAGQSF